MQMKQDVKLHVRWQLLFDYNKVYSLSLAGGQRKDATITLVAGDADGLAYALSECETVSSRDYRLVIL